MLATNSKYCLSAVACSHMVQALMKKHHHARSDMMLHNRSSFILKLKTYDHHTTLNNMRRHVARALHENNSRKFLNFSQKGRRWYWPSLCPPSVHEHGGSTSILRMEEYEYHILFLSSKLKHRYHTSKRCVNIQFFMIGLTFTGIIQFSKNVDRIFYKRV